MTRPAVLLVGCGRMGGALLRAWRAEARDLFVLDPSLEAVEGATLLSGPDEVAGLPRPLIVVLAVKPRLVGRLAHQLASHLGPGVTVVSIAAGIGLTALSTVFPDVDAMVRVMPNTAVEVGAGASAMAAAPGTSEAALDAVQGLLAATGLVIRLQHEDQMDAVTAVSGSGPAYFFAFAEALAEGGRRQGLPAAVATALARQTLAGAGALAAASTKPLGALRAEVTSPGGTTAAGLERLGLDDALTDLAAETVAAATGRSRDLGRATEPVTS